MQRLTVWPRRTKLVFVHYRGASGVDCFFGGVVLQPHLGLFRPAFFYLLSAAGCAFAQPPAHLTAGCEMTRPRCWPRRCDGDMHVGG